MFLDSLFMPLSLRYFFFCYCYYSQWLCNRRARQSRVAFGRVAIERHTPPHTRAHEKLTHTLTQLHARGHRRSGERARSYTSTVWFPVCFTGVPVILAPPHPTSLSVPPPAVWPTSRRSVPPFTIEHTHRMTHSRTHIHTHAHILHSYSASSLRCFNVVPETPQSARGEKETHFTFNFWQPIPRTGHRQQHTTFSHTAATAASSSCRRDFQFMLAVFNFTHERH